MITRRDLLRSVALGVTSAAVTKAAARSGDYAESIKQTWRHATNTPTDLYALQRELIRYATLAANGHNTQPWKFRARGDAIDILPDLTRRTPVVDPDDHHLWVSLGCAAENLALAAAAFGRHAEVVAMSTGVRAALSPAPPARSPLFEAIPRRQSTRAEYDGRPLTAGTLHQLEQSTIDLPVQTLLITDRGGLSRIEELVIAGNTAQMNDPAFIAELKAWIRFSESEALEQRDGLFAAATGNPVLPRWLGSMLFSLFVTTRAENAKIVKHLRSSAGVAVFAAERADQVGWMAAGRALQRFLLQASALDIRTAFINQPIEVGALRGRFAAEMQLGDRRPDLVVRFGRGNVLPPSLRRPVDTVIE